MRTALYARCSTDKQDAEMQLREFKEYCERRQWNVTAEYVDIGISGSKERRPQLDRLMQDARKRRFDAVVCYRFDRFARSTRHLLNALAEFQALGVEFISLHEGIDTSTPHGKFTFVVLAAVAELERSIIRERVISGVRAAKAKGKTLGRPRIAVDVVKVRLLRSQGHSLRRIASSLGVSVGRIHASVFNNPSF